MRANTRLWTGKNGFKLIFQSSILFSTSLKKIKEICYNSFLYSYSNSNKNLQIKQRIKKVISGTPEYPRLSIFRSNKEIYCQVIDDINGKTLVQTSSRDKAISDLKLKSNIEISFNVGKSVAEQAVKKGIDKIKFDRGGYLYHGRVKSLAEGAREGGLKF